MNELVQAALSDLRSRFGAGKMVLTTEELAQAIGSTPGALATIRHRQKERFPLKPIPLPVGGGYGYSIFQAAQLLGLGTIDLSTNDDDRVPPSAEKPRTTPPAATRKKAKGRYDHLFQWQKSWQDAAEQARIELETEIEFLRHLDAALLATDEKIGSGTPKTAHTKSV